MHILVGYPFPLGATFDGVGTNFSLFSEIAERVPEAVHSAADTGNKILLLYGKVYPHVQDTAGKRKA